MQHFLADLTPATAALLIGALLLAFGFEAINGFHDTANAVATVIYTNTLKPWYAVVWSGLWNFIGVVVSGGAVAFGIVALLPVELVIHAGSAAGFAMVFALLFSAHDLELRPRGTSASGLELAHADRIDLGVGLTNAVLAKHPFGDGVNWGKLHDTFMALFLSPIVGFVCAALCCS